jgi:hypothetical protein
VKRVSQSDRRHEARLPQVLEVVVRELPQLGCAEHPESHSVAGFVQNMSEGGVCLVTPCPVGETAILRCEIAIGDAPLRVATLMQVRWTRKQDVKQESFISGLEVLL